MLLLRVLYTSRFSIWDGNWREKKERTEKSESGRWARKLLPGKEKKGHKKEKKKKGSLSLEIKRKGERERESLQLLFLTKKSGSLLHCLLLFPAPFFEKTDFRFSSSPLPPISLLACLSSSSFHQNLSCFLLPVGSEGQFVRNPPPSLSPSALASIFSPLPLAPGRTLSGLGKAGWSSTNQVERGPG